VEAIEAIETCKAIRWFTARPVPDEVPVLVAVVGLPQFPDQEHDPERLLIYSLYGVTQNLLVAARSLGLGTTLTMFHEIDEDLVKDCLGMPSAVRIASLVPMGWPAERFVRVKRHPLETLVHWEQW
jgi:nitroreductase